MRQEFCEHPGHKSPQEINYPPGHRNVARRTWDLRFSQGLDGTHVPPLSQNGYGCRSGPTDMAPPIGTALPLARHGQLTRQGKQAHHSDTSNRHGSATMRHAAERHGTAIRHGMGPTAGTNSWASKYNATTRRCLAICSARPTGTARRIGAQIWHAQMIQLWNRLGTVDSYVVPFSLAR